MITGLTDGQHTVEVRAFDRAGNYNDISRIFNVDIVALSGAVKNANGSAIANAKVTLSNGMSTTTDANGAFSFSNVTEGSYNLTVSKDGYQPVTRNGITIAAEQTTDIGPISVQAAVSTSDSGLTVTVVAVAIIALLAVGALAFFKRRKK